MVQRTEELPGSYASFDCGEEVLGPHQSGENTNECEEAATVLVTQDDGSHLAVCPLHVPKN